MMVEAVMIWSVACFSGLSKERSSESKVAVVQFFVLSFSKASACSAKDAAGAGVDCASFEDASGVGGEVVVSGGVIPGLQFEGDDEEF